MVQFHDSKQERRYAQLRESEEEEAMLLLSKKYGIPYVDLTSVPINSDALILFSETAAREAEVVAFNRLNKVVDVGVHSPDSPKTKAVLEELSSRGFAFSTYLVSHKSLAFAWDRYKDMTFTSESRRGMLDVSGEDILKFMAEVKSTEDVKAHITETMQMKKAFRTSRIVEVLLASALATHSSDVHIEPEEKQVRLRLRLDGLLTDISMFDAETYRLLLSRIKLLSGLKLNVQSEAQDGRFSIKMGESEIEIRTSILPGQYGESIVMRVLNPDSIAVSIDRLGMRPELRAEIEHQVAKPNGMILTTGPTGSGKTTTLYAFLRKVHSPEVKIITIEDPIEYHLKGIVQTQVENEKDYTFSSGLRAALRQDPDIIMVGEIRDGETAEIAIHAALTGHLVFSTLHTNSAAGVFPRLIDLGINSRIIGSALNLALAQRLVRTLCSSCRVEAPLAGDEKALVDKVFNESIHPELLAGVQREKIWRPGTGCDACGGVGYKGRIGVFEAIKMTEAVENAVEMNPSERDIRKAAADQGFLTITEDAVVKALEGATTLDEIARVVDIS
ncbi:MAG TPA: GspE/PulE family protein [Candidatus Paceibacterota bacterium]|nr:GspE/PulE family protein [Candidatus Paceibacterota bacterium]